MTEALTDPSTAPGSDEIAEEVPTPQEYARVGLTPVAAALLEKLSRQYGPLMFHQSGGCCDGSSPMCYPDGDFIIGDADVHLADLVVPGLDATIPFYMSQSQYGYWSHTHLTVDVVKGRGSGFSVEAPEGVRFMIRSRLLTDPELAAFGLGLTAPVSGPVALDAVGNQRTVVAHSWQRSAAAGVDAEANIAPLVFESRELAGYREEHPLARVFPLLYDVLGRTAEENDCVMAVGDEHGALLWLSGRAGVLRRAESINFVEGSSWAEPAAGTNAPGTALRLDAPVHIRSHEHYTRSVQPWSCAAAPIHDPATQQILGVVDLTGGDEVAVPMTMGVVRAAARMAETELSRLAALADIGTRDGRREVPGSVQVAGLGRPDCRIRQGARVLRLSPRHSEILVLLLDEPDGLTGDQLAVELYRDDVQPSTLRAELTRLKAILGDDTIDSRPYRLRHPAVADWNLVERRLREGRVHEALSAYRGPLLPFSDAPGVVRRRERLAGQLRTAILASNDVDLMVAWTRRRWGADDLPMWQRQLDGLSVGSPLRPLAIAEVRRLDHELRVP